MKQPKDQPDTVSTPETWAKQPTPLPGPLSLNTSAADAFPDFLSRRWSPPILRGYHSDPLIINVDPPIIKPVTKRKTGKLSTRSPMLNANDRDHHHVVSPIRKEWRRRGRGLANAHRVRAYGWQHAQIDAFIHRQRRGRADVGNFYPTVKHVVDGFIDAGLLPDDNDNHLWGPFLHPGNSGYYGVTIVITPLH